MQSFGPEIESPDLPKKNQSELKKLDIAPKSAADLKQILESSKVIDHIFHQRTRKIEAEKKAEEERKKKEDEEYKEVLEANKSLKDSLAGRKSTGSKITLAN